MSGTGLHTLSKPLGLDVIKYPSGQYGFVGDVPVALAYEWESEDDLRAAIEVGPGMAKRIAALNGRKFACRSFASEAAAWEAHHKLVEVP
jgi:hypothetical protein